MQKKIFRFITPTTVLIFLFFLIFLFIGNLIAAGKIQWIGRIKKISSENNITIKFEEELFSSYYKEKADEIFSKSKTTGTELYVIKPGFEELILEVGRYVGNNEILAYIKKGTIEGLLPGEMVFHDIKQIKENRKTYINLKNKIRKQKLNWTQIKSHLSWSEKNILKKKTIWNGMKNLLTIVKSLIKNKDLKARAHFRLGTAFKNEISRYHIISELDDVINSREMFYEVTKYYFEDNYWVERANFNLAFLYNNIMWETKNITMFNFLKNAGRFGKIYLDYARNILNTMAEDSILLTEGKDNQVFGLQMLIQIDEKRPDITVYDQKGDLFDMIYGDPSLMTPAQYFENQVSADKLLITEKTPPRTTEIRSFVTKKRALRKRKGYVYYTWSADKRLEKINEQLKAEGKPTYHLEPIGLLYQVVEDGKKLQSPYNQDNVWREYYFDWKRYNCRGFPYIVREILANIEFRYGNHFLRKEDYKSAESHYLEAMKLGYDILPNIENSGRLFSDTFVNAYSNDRKKAMEYVDMGIKNLLAAERIAAIYLKRDVPRIRKFLLEAYKKKLSYTDDEDNKAELNKKITGLQKILGG